MSAGATCSASTPARRSSDPCGGHGVVCSWSVPEQSGGFPMDTEGRWLTYGELASIRGTKRASAIKLAQRERWPRQAGNDRSQTVRVLVPGEWLVSAKDKPVEPQ